MSVHLGWCSPLPPAQSGVADYSAELLPALAARTDVTCFAPQPDEVLPQLRAHLRVLPIHAIGEAPDVLPVYHLGNHVGFHADIVRAALQRPGVVVLHEYVLHDLIQRLFLGAGQVRGFGSWIRAAEPGVSGARIGAAVRCRMPPHEMPLCEPLVRSSKATVVLNRWAQAELHERCPDALVRLVPSHAIAPPQITTDTAQLRRRYQLPEQAFVVGSFGHQTPNKRLDVALQAFARLREAFSDSLYILVGPPSARFDAAAYARRLGVGDAVRTFGYVQERLWWELLACTDLCVSLRWPTQGETSASVLKQLAAGKAVCVSAAGPDLDYPGDVVCHIPPSDDEVDQLWLAMRRAATDPQWRERLGTRGRAYVREAHAVEHAAAALLDVCEDAAPREPDSRFDLDAALHGDTGVAAAWHRWVFRGRLARSIGRRHGWWALRRRLGGWAAAL